MSPAPDVLVVGCGAQGLSTALHLARLGVRVLAVDRADPGTQTSARAAGQSVLAQTEPACGELMHRTVAKMLRFEEENGIPLDVHQVGSVKLALSDWAAAQLEREVERATAIGARMQLVDVDEAASLAPHIDATKAVAAWHSPDDCYWQPPEMLAALHAAAMHAGVEFQRGVEVEAITVTAGRVTGAEATTGPIRAGRVLVTAGAWAKPLLERAGIGPLPIAFVRHQYSIRAGVPGVDPALPSVRIVDHAVYARPVGTNLMFGTYEPAPLEFAPSSVPARAEDVPLDRGPNDEALRQVAGVFGSAIDAPVVELRGGVVTMTPDRGYLIDRAPEADGLYFSTGCNVMGLSIAPAFGEDMATWITSGARPATFAPFGLDRFAGAGLTADEARRRSLQRYESIYRDDDSAGHVRHYGR
jgi:4-methylaminobutanoate oxidase (formaldehyde-forming)